MADDRSPNHPRRAVGDDAPTTDRPGPDEQTSGSTDTTSGSPDPAATAEGPGTGTPEQVIGRFTEDEARPIFREAASDADAATVRTPPPAGGSVPDATPTAPTTGEQASDAAGPATGRTRLNFTPRPRPVDDDEATTLLPRTTGGSAGPPPLDGAGGEDDEVDEIDGGAHRFGRRTRLALLVGAVAAVVVVGLAIGYAVVGVRDQPGGTTGPASTASSAAATPSAAAVLDDASMLTPDGAQAIDTKRTWTLGTTVRGPVPDGSGPGCVGSDPVEGAPTAQQTITRTVTASGSDAPSALHVAQAYATPEDATQAFTATSRALGSCAVTGDWLFTGRVVQGLGDGATAAAVHSVADGKTVQRWVVVARTGRVLDIVDAGTPGKKALNVNDVTRSVSSVLGTQCGPAGGTCTTAAATTTDGPPPPGGDEPGFLATGDLPPVGSSTAPWVGTPVEPPTEDFTGSQCESVNWSTTAATSRSSRVYLLQDVPGIFGLNQIVLTTKDAGTASKLVDKIRSDWTSCRERKLTATVASPTKVTGVAADGAPVVGYTTEVEQKAGSTTTRFRVGIASSGDKVAFVFLNPQKGLDVDGSDWNVVAVRAVQRATQQS